MINQKSSIMGPLLMLSAALLFTLMTTLVKLMPQGFFFCRGFEGGVYMSSEVVFSSIIGILFLNDPVTWHFFTGGILILGSGLALNWLGMVERKDSPG